MEKEIKAEYVCEVCTGMRCRVITEPIVPGEDGYIISEPMCCVHIPMFKGIAEWKEIN